MGTLTKLFHELLFIPLLNLLVFLYNLFGDFGVAIIIVTVIVRILLYPIAKKTLVHQKALRKIQPKIKELQVKHKDDKETLSKEMMALYKEHNFNPASGCLPMIVQLIVLIALYRVFLSVTDNPHYEELYAWVKNPGQINTYFFGWFDLGKKSAEIGMGGVKIFSWAGVILALIAGFLQFYQTKISIAKQKDRKVQTEQNPEEDQDKKTNEPDITEIMNKQMLYFFPFFTIFIGLSFPAGLSLYWTVTTLLLIGQQHLLDREDKTN